MAGRAVSYADMVCDYDRAGNRNVYYLTKSFYSEDMRKEHERLQYIEELKKQGQERARVESMKDISDAAKDTTEKH